MKIFFFLTTFCFISINLVTIANEPFVILNYNNFKNIDSKEIDEGNPFLKDSNYNKVHMVLEGDSLSGIISQYYNNTGLNKRVLEVSIIEMNTHAFVRKNPHFLFAGKKLKIPSINEIMNLVKNKPNKEIKSNSSANHIYFFGVN